MVAGSPVRKRRVFFKGLTGGFGLIVFLTHGVQDEIPKEMLLFLYFCPRNYCSSVLK